MLVESLKKYVNQDKASVSNDLNDLNLAALSFCHVTIFKIAISPVVKFYHGFEVIKRLAIRQVMRSLRTPNESEE